MFLFSIISLYDPNTLYCLHCVKYQAAHNTPMPEVMIEDFYDSFQKTIKVH